MIETNEDAPDKVKSTTEKAGVPKSNEGKAHAAASPGPPSEASEGATEPSISDLADSLKSTSSKLDDLKKLFEDRIAIDDKNAKQLNHLYDELCYYKHQFVFEMVLKRVFKDLILLYDRIESIASFCRESGSVSEDMLNNLMSFTQEITDILRRQEVTPVVELEKFDEEFHEAIDVERTDIAEEHHTIAKIVKRGFLYRRNTLLRPEKVIVKRYEEQTEDMEGRQNG